MGTVRLNGTGKGHVRMTGGSGRRGGLGQALHAPEFRALWSAELVSVPYAGRLGLGATAAGLLTAADPPGSGLEAWLLTRFASARPRPRAIGVAAAGLVGAQGHQERFDMPLSSRIDVTTGRTRLAGWRVRPPVALTAGGWVPATSGDHSVFAGECAKTLFERLTIGHRAR